MSIPYDSNTYRCTILRHIDADSSIVEIDYGFHERGDKSIRWDGIDAPERFTEAGKAATAFVNTFLPVGRACYLTTRLDKQDKYGRYLGTFWLFPDDEVSVNEVLIREGHAVAYMGA